ncbi:MAG: hypothetical protein H0X17_20105 [Deltaproteobacteria bacterium]|nr:hypothetical protein [Deltaproteobacteria bacterium]
MMSGRRPKDGTGSADRLAGVGLAMLAVVCCAGGPLLIAALGSIGVGAVLGVGAGVLAALALITGIAIAARRRKIHRDAASDEGGTRRRSVVG